jgi:hypothetical protein
MYDQVFGSRLYVDRVIKPICTYIQPSETPAFIPVLALRGGMTGCVAHWEFTHTHLWSSELKTSSKISKDVFQQKNIIDENRQR